MLFLASLLGVVRAQFGFDSPFAFGGGLDVPLQAQRDSRQDRGPVVFPQAPPDNGETSGVVVGASGYGFVPPNNPGLKAPTLQLKRGTLTLFALKLES